MATAVDKAYRAIREKILSGEFPAGQHLTEAELAEQIKVSRTPVREALRRLNAEHLVKFIRNQGAFVAAWPESEIDEIFMLRSMVEGYAAELAATRISEADIRKLDRYAEEMVTVYDGRGPDYLDRIADLNGKFHRLILNAAKSERLELVLSWLVEMPIVLSTFKRYSDADMWRSLEHHREIVAAMKAHDGDWASTVMRSHVLAARRVYLEAQKSEPPPGPIDAAAE